MLGGFPLLPLRASGGVIALMRGGFVSCVPPNTQIELESTTFAESAVLRYSKCKVFDERSQARTTILQESSSSRPADRPDVLKAFRAASGS